MTANLKTIQPIVTIVAYTNDGENLKPIKFNVEVESFLGLNGFLFLSLFWLLPSKAPKKKELNGGRQLLGTLSLTASGKINFKESEVNLTLNGKTEAVNLIDGTACETSSQLAQVAYSKLLELAPKTSNYSYQPYYLIWNELLLDAHDNSIQLSKLATAEIETVTPTALLDAINKVIAKHDSPELKVVANFLQSQVTAAKSTETKTTTTKATK